MRTHAFHVALKGGAAGLVACQAYPLSQSLRTDGDVRAIIVGGTPVGKTI